MNKDIHQDIQEDIREENFEENQKKIFEDEYEKYIQKCKKTIGLGLHCDQCSSIRNKHAFFGNVKHHCNTHFFVENEGSLLPSWENY